MKIGFIGLGRMGFRMAGKITEDGHEVFVWNRTKSTIEEFINKYPKAGNIETVEELVHTLEKPRVIWSMLPAGEPTQTMLDEIEKYAEEDDIIIDGGNAYYKDTQRRYEHFKKRKIKFLGIGVSGGVIAEKEGYPIMAGGDKTAFKHIIPVLDSLASPNGGYEYFGEGGAGHFVKMIHNGIEYGIMQSLAEGFEILEKGPYKFDLLKIGKLWQKGTLVSGFLLDRAVEALTQDSTLSEFSGPVSESGEARWTVEQAKEEGVAAEIIESSLQYRIRSNKEKKLQRSFTVKVLNALRFQFGRHRIEQK